MTGQLAKEQVDLFVTEPGYEQIPDPLKREILEDIYSEARAVARERLRAELLASEPGRAALAPDPDVLRALRGAGGLSP